MRAGLPQAFADLLGAAGIAHRLAVGFQDLEGIHHHVLAGVDDACLDHVESQLVEHAGQGGEEIGTVCAEDGEFRAAAARFFVQQHKCTIVRVVMEKRAGVPGDLGRRAALEVFITQLRPQGLHLPGADVTLLQQGAGLAARARDVVGQRFGILHPAAQGLAGFEIELAQQAVLPVVPQARAGGADIGHRQQVEVVEAGFFAHLLGEGVDHHRVGNVLALRHV